MKIAIIPARGGSKRIPKKNIKLFFGKPMIAWSIEAAKKSNVFDHIIVSTDDEDIANIARQYGAEVPFLRPAHLSDDYAGTTAVIAHAVQWALDQQWDIDAACCIYATAPFVIAKDIVEGLKKLQQGTWAYSFSVTSFAAPIFRGFKITDAGGVEMFFPENFSMRSQDLTEAFHDAGQFYWGKPMSWINELAIFDSHSYPIVIPSWRVQDIDTEEDWLQSELKYKVLCDKELL